ncbi:hypothetical protein J2S30_002850 [Herbaspirillum rubrisubalbicans]|uniref:hypothetical protein n=1 Tax=Herbaspirillum rubrisubalbicans TaxID=80842 RepID=UPI0020A0C50D|nr:hypothetical protein [Herbaspirillum rubrisubalbicans]MCP1574471.1 hypothetical protein [Herbaspirillum rubrisubalbicans]
MLKRHEDQLWARLDELYANGTTYISWNELYHWYNTQRIAKAPWRDIKARWEQVLEEKEEKYIDPLVAEVHGGISFFFAPKPGQLSKLAA